MPIRAVNASGSGLVSGDLSKTNGRGGVVGTRLLPGVIPTFTCLAGLYVFVSNFVVISLIPESNTSVGVCVA